MVRPALEVADILRDHGSAWRHANQGHVSLGQLKVMSAIERCRTAALGGARRTLREHGVRPDGDRVQLLRQPALSEVPGCGVTPMAGRPRSGALAGAVFSRRLHAAE